MMRRLNIAVMVMTAWVFATPMAQASKSHYTISLKEIETQIGKRLIEDGAADDISVNLLGNHRNVMHTSKRPLHYVIDYLDFEPRSSRFQTSISIYEGEKLAKQMELNGRYSALVDVPVLNKRIYSGETIEEADIEWIKTPEHRLRKHVIFSPKRLIGKSPLRVLTPDRPIQFNEIEQPQIVDKGDLVQVRYISSHMEIRTLGKALESGALNDSISIQNNESGIVIQGKVVGPGLAEVNQIMQLSSNTR